MSLRMVMSRCSPNKFLVTSECMALELAPKTSEVQSLTSISSVRLPQTMVVSLSMSADSVFSNPS